MIMKKKCALYASKLVKDGMVVGLGGGSTISYLIDYVKDKDIKVVSPSSKTVLLAQKMGLTVLNTQYVDHVDIAFDGCDEVDSHLNALKSGGGIHTQEKIIASMAGEYIVLVDESKFHETLAFKVPVVVEVLPKAYSIVKKKIEKLNGNIELRTASNKDGFLMSDEGNILLDVYFDGVQDIRLLNQTLLMMPGVVDTSLFVDILTGMILVNDKGVFKRKKWRILCLIIGELLVLAGLRMIWQML